MVEHQLGRHSLVKLTIVNKALLESQPKLLNPFGHKFFFFLSLLGLILLVLILLYLCCNVQRFRGCCGEGEITWRALCRLWGRVKLNVGNFLHLEDFCKNPG